MLGFHIGRGLYHLTNAHPWWSSWFLTKIGNSNSLWWCILNFFSAFLTAFQHLVQHILLHFKLFFSICYSIPSWLLHWWTSPSSSSGPPPQPPPSSPASQPRPCAEEAFSRVINTQRCQYLCSFSLFPLPALKSWVRFSSLACHVSKMRTTYFVRYRTSQRVDLLQKDRWNETLFPQWDEQYGHLQQDFFNASFSTALLVVRICTVMTLKNKNSLWTLGGDCDDN